ncbi:hypothetical protein EAG_05672 [Camponotus floridanus]|uniref:DDE-1 domain-containing protein n=1 Tax=Camponotus floridanus TaxID=104421 RepID=E1ZXW1_CAMFO|nr:hypothetical protein EAG_05672 [Camponotus floridanus]
MLCINVTGSHKLPPFTGEVTNDDQTLEEDVIKGSKAFEFWYEKMFKENVREYQSKEKITGKVFLLVENWTQYILLTQNYLSQKIAQDDDVKMLILPINTVSFFKPLYPEFINEVNRIFEIYLLQRIDKLTNCYEKPLVKEFNRSYNINFHISAIAKSWLEVRIENVEESRRKFLELLQGPQTHEDLVLSTEHLVNYIIRFYS